MLAVVLIGASIGNTRTARGHLGKLVNGHVSRHANVEAAGVTRALHHHGLHAHLPLLRRGSSLHLLLRLDLGGRLSLGAHVLKKIGPKKGGLREGGG